MHSAGRTDVWVIQDALGRQVGWSKTDLRTGAGVSMKLRPKPGDRAAVPGTDGLLRGNTYFPVQAAGPTPTAVEHSVTPR